MSRKNNIEAQQKINYEKSRYVIRRFVPALLLAVAAIISFLAVDVSKVSWVGVISGTLLAIALFLIRTSAEKRFPKSGPTNGGS